MKKSTAGIALAAAVGFSALTATPAMAVHLPFENCGEAAALGVYNIPVGTPGYGPHLDSDSDGIGCENDSVAYNANLVVDHPAPVEEDDQVADVPMGAPDTGVSVSPESTSNTGLLALGGTAVLVAAAGGTFMIRRRSADQA